MEARVPIVHGKLEDYDGLSLTIWSSLEIPQRTAGAERVAQIIGRAIADWAASGKYKPARPSYGDRMLRVEYTPLPADVVIKRALLEKVKWNPMASGERFSP
jgi:hypothetical protein